jgi:hypothetical protein
MTACANYLDGCKCEGCAAREYSILAKGDPTIPKVAVSSSEPKEGVPVMQGKHLGAIACATSNVRQDERLLKDVRNLVDALVSGSLGTYDTKTQVVVDREDLQAERDALADARMRHGPHAPTGRTFHALNAWLSEEKKP